MNRSGPKTIAIFPLESNPRSSFLTSVSVGFSVHSTQESVAKTDPICDDSAFKTEAASIGPAQKSIRNDVLYVSQSPSTRAMSTLTPISDQFFCRRDAALLACVSGFF